MGPQAQSEFFHLSPLFCWCLLYCRARQSAGLRYLSHAPNNGWCCCVHESWHLVLVPYSGVNQLGECAFCSTSCLLPGTSVSRQVLHCMHLTGLKLRAVRGFQSGRCSCSGGAHHGGGCAVRDGGAGSCWAAGSCARRADVSGGICFRQGCMGHIRPSSVPVGATHEVYQLPCRSYLFRGSINLWYAGPMMFYFLCSG